MEIANTGRRTKRKKKSKVTENCESYKLHHNFKDQQFRRDLVKSALPWELDEHVLKQSAGMLVGHRGRMLQEGVFISLCHFPMFLNKTLNLSDHKRENSPHLG